MLFLRGVIDLGGELHVKGRIIFFFFFMVTNLGGRVSLIHFDIDMF